MQLNGDRMSFKNQGFTLIELVIFIIVLGIVSAILLVTIVFALKATPIEHNQNVTTNTANMCLSYILGQRYLNGFNFNGQSCPGSADSNLLPDFCKTLTPGGFTTTVNISCATVSGFGGAQAFKLVRVVTAAGNQAANTTLNLLIADY